MRDATGDPNLLEFVLPQRQPVPAGLSADQALIARIAAGDTAAAALFLQRAIPLLSTAIAKIEPRQEDQQAALLYVLAALKDENYRRLKAFDGRASLGSFLALLARELLARRAIDTLLADRDAGWPRFKRVFDHDIQTRIARQFRFDGGTGRWEDIYQDICAKLVEGDCKRLRGYGGKGSFIGFVLKIVQNLLRDEVRREVSRRRLPAAIERMQPLAQEIYKVVAWEDCPLDLPQLAARLRGRLADNPSEADIGKVLAQITEIMPALRAAQPSKPKLVSLDGPGTTAESTLAASSATPEEDLLLAEEERAREALIAHIRAKAEELSAEERLYLQLAFGAETMQRQKIAEAMRCSVDDVDRLKKKLQRWFATIRRSYETDDNFSRAKSDRS